MDPILETIIEKSEPVIEVIVETKDGVTTETKTTTIVEVTTKPTADLLDDYDEQITNLEQGVQKNLDQVDFLNAEIVKIKQRKKDALS